MAEEYTRLRHNVETEQWLAEGHRDYAAATTDITAVLDLLRDARRLMKCHELEDEQGRWAACSEIGMKDKALSHDEWCDACLWIERAEEAGVPHGGSQ